MSNNREMGKENVVHIYSGILLSHIKNKIIFFAATQMELEIFILNEASQTERQISYDIA